jgi:hypothetical protein
VGIITGIALPGQREQLTNVNFVSPGYFELMKMRMVAGRPFQPSDKPDARPAPVVALVRVVVFGTTHPQFFGKDSLAGQLFEAIEAAVRKLSAHAISQTSGKSAVRRSANDRAKARKALRRQLETISRTAACSWRNSGCPVTAPIAPWWRPATCSHCKPGR